MSDSLSEPYNTPPIQKSREDRWNTNPPQVTSYLVYLRPEASKGDRWKTIRDTSPACGFGWRFVVETSKSRPGKVDVIFQRHKCSSSLSDIVVNVKVSYPEDNAKSVEEKFTCFSTNSESNIGTYLQPKKEAHFEVTLTFNTSDDLSLPTISESQTDTSLKAFHYSLDGPSFSDTKFYLFSARIQGRPAIPKAVFARSQLLIDSSTYLQDLISPTTEFSGGTPCDLRQDVPEEIAKLNPEIYDYDSDSDLEDDVVPEGQGKEKAPEPESTPDDAGVGKPRNQAKQDLVARVQDGRAFAVNGTAHKTWKAFIFYTYTNVVHFNALRSRSRGPESPDERMPRHPGLISCSPKSMYRFADYAGLPALKTLALKEIRENLDVSNIISELFSLFTSRYQEIIELEVEFLSRNFSPEVAQDLDDMVQLIAQGTKPHCSRALAFTLRSLLDDTGSLYSI